MAHVNFKYLTEGLLNLCHLEVGCACLYVCVFTVFRRQSFHIYLWQGGNVVCLCDCLSREALLEIPGQCWDRYRL